MTMLRTAILVAALAAVLGGCSTINKMTGSVDNTVLPGQREDAIPGRAKFPESDPASTASTASTAAPPDAAEPACSADDPDCAPPSGDDTFSDPQ